MEIFMAIMALTSLAMGAYQMRAQAKAEKQAAEYNAQIARNQAEWAEYNAKRKQEDALNMAKVADMNAALAKADAEKAASRKQEEIDRLVSAQKARFLKSGIQLTGTPLDVMAQTMVEGERDKVDLLEIGEREGWEWDVKATNYRNQASDAIIEGANAANVWSSQADLNLMDAANAGKTGLLNTGAAIASGLGQNGKTILTGYDAVKKKFTKSALDPTAYNYD